MKRIGRVLGTESKWATPLDFWVAIEPEAYLQLDDVVALETGLPDGRQIRLYGLVTEVRARHEGARFDSDVFLIEDGILPADVARVARVVATRFEPEVFVPPLPGTAVRKAAGTERDEALFFDGMQKRLPVGLSRDEEPLYANLEFLDGTGVPTSTSAASPALPPRRPMRPSCCTACSGREPSVRTP